MFSILQVRFDIPQHQHILLCNSDISSTPQLSSPKITIKEFQLDRFQLAFTLGKRETINDNLVKIPDVRTTVFSDELTEINRQRSQGDDKPMNLSLKKPMTLNFSHCQILKYFPRRGHIDGGDEIFIMFDSILRTSKYGGELIIFSSTR